MKRNVPVISFQDEHHGTKILNHLYEITSSIGNYYSIQLKDQNILFSHCPLKADRKKNNHTYTIVYSY